MKFALTGLLLLLPFFSLPWLHNPNATAKAYLFFFWVLCLLIWMFLRQKTFFWDKGVLFCLLSICSFSISAYFNGNMAVSWQFVAMVATVSGFYYLVVCWSRHCHDVTTILMKVLLSVSVVFSLFGLGQGVDYLVNGQRAGMLIPYLLPGTWGLRVSGPFGQPNFHALLMLSGLCSFAYVYVKEVWGKRDVRIQSTALLLPLLMWLNFFQTDSRGGQVAFVAVVLTSLWIKKRLPVLQTIHQGYRLLALLAGLGFLAYGLRRLLIYLLFEPSLVSGLRVAQSYSITTRLNMWLTSLLMTCDHPFFGVGPDNFKRFLPEYQLRAQKILQFEYEDLVYTRWAHNEYFQVLAEGGGVTFGVLTILFGFLLYKNYNKLKISPNPYSVFAFLAMIPFVVQAAFDWPLRFTPLVAMFIAISAALLPVNQGIEIELGKWSRGLLVLLCVMLFSAGIWSFVSDLRVSKLRQSLNLKENVMEGFSRFSRLSEDYFAENELLTRGITPFVSYAVREEDRVLAGRLLPFLERAVFFDGAYWQWYNLARVFFVVGEEQKAMTAILKCIDLNPLYGPGWAFRHHLDVVEAVRKTGRPIESFYSKGVPELDLDYGRDIILQNQ